MPSESSDSITIDLNGELNNINQTAKELGYKNASAYLIALHHLNQKGILNLPKKGAASLADDFLNIPKVAFEYVNGTIFQGDSANLMQNYLPADSVDLIVTSPPFGLVKKKNYGNEDSDEYLDWFEQFAVGFSRVLKKSGSLVIDIGGAWKKGFPVRSLYHFELLIRLCRSHGFHLAQEFYWWNPAKLPLPAEWVNIRRIRVRDSINCIWWLSKTPYPKASNKRVLQPYSGSMKQLHARGKYNAEKRSGGHKPSDRSFLKDHGGSIPHNLLAIANTKSNGPYYKYCRENNLPVHPAQFPPAIPAFFIRMLTDKQDTVLDPFAGSCITGRVAHEMGRRWICCELREEYVEGAKGRFKDSESQNSNNIKNTRLTPYKIYPPHLSIITEEDSPFLQDGGRSRPVSSE